MSPSRYQFTSQDRVKSGNRSKERRVSIDSLIAGTHGLKGTTLRDRLIEEGLIEDKCIICGWSEKRAGYKYSVCHLDHIDGNNRNKRFENLRLLCPNHHALTPTYCKQKVSTRGRKTGGRISGVKIPPCA